MGIPSFYRWLLDKYPKAVVDVIEDEVEEGSPSSIDTTQPNPNGLEFDNLYLDMNGIVHPCFHPEGLPAPRSYDEVFMAVFNYIDRIFSIVRPRKLLYLAIDGVAPRAKMNQQRTRRFRAAKDAADEAALAEQERMGSIFESEEEKAALLEQSKKLDSNVITPGTEFMALLSSALRYYIHLRMNKDPGWRGIKVILSDANVPGEGEHKIMSYIRLQRNLPGYDPNTRHCLYGLDADLVMLALATHEIHFSILREDVRNAEKTTKLLKQMEVVGKNLENYISRQKFQFLNIWVLREYLARDMKIQDSKVKLDLERLIDDFVFMCLFVGNDFLPHMPSLEISEGAIDLLMKVYKKEFVGTDGYLTNSFEVNLERVQHFVQSVGSHECPIFRKRGQMRKRRWIGSQPNIQKKRNNRSRRSSRNKNVSSGNRTMSQNPPNSTAIAIQTPSSIGENGVMDKIKLGEEGWKERYYAEKFEAKTQDDHERIRRNAVFKYIEGMCWVMRYYYEGVCSWQWFYPYHYAPFASDFYDIHLLKVQFTLGKPFKPFDQLLGVLPAASAHALPLFYRKLMTDMSSPLLDFYPDDFELDMNGKRFSWQAICKLPFIEESRLLTEIAKVEHTLTEEERSRNSFSLDVLFVHSSHPLAVKIITFFKSKCGHPKLLMTKVKQKINPEFSGGMNGYMYISDKSVQPMEIYSPVEDMEMIANNEVISVFYKFPAFHPHIPRLSEGVQFPTKSVRKKDILAPPVLWHEKSAIFGRRFSERCVHKSISGKRLAKSAYKLLNKCYHSKRQKTLGSMELGEHIGADGLTAHSNLEETVHVDGTGGDKNIIDDRSREVTQIGRKDDGIPGDKICVGGKSNKRKRSKDSGVAVNHVGEEVLACSRYSEETVGRTGGNKNCIDNEAKGNPADSNGLACNLNLDETVSGSGAGGDKNCIGVRLACPSNSAQTICEAGNGDDKNCTVSKAGTEGDKNCAEGRSRKRRRKWSKANGVLDKHVDDAVENHVGVAKSACPSNLGQTVYEAAKGGDKNCVDEQCKVGGTVDNHVGEMRLACPSNFVQTVCETGDKNCVDKWRKVEGAVDNHVGKMDLACPSNLGRTVCKAGTEGDKKCVDKWSKVGGAEVNHVGSMKLASPFNLGQKVGQKVFEAGDGGGYFVVVSSRKQKQIR